MKLAPPMCVVIIHRRTLVLSMRKRDAIHVRESEKYAIGHFLAIFVFVPKKIFDFPRKLYNNIIMKALVSLRLSIL